MKMKIYKCVLIVFAPLCAFSAYLAMFFSASFTSVLAFPFEQLGLMLRWLSLSSDVGNVFSFIFYIVLSLIPLFILIILLKKKALFWEDGLLAVLSLLLFAVIYLMINPSEIECIVPEAIEINKAILGSSVYCVIFGYIVLRCLRLFFAANTQKLYKYMQLLLCAVNFMFVYAVFNMCLYRFFSSVEILLLSNKGSENALGLTYVFLATQLVIDALPYALNIAIIYSTQNALGLQDEALFSDKALMAFKKLSLLCKISLTTIIASNIAFNLLQVLYMRNLRVVNSYLQIPVLSVVIVLAVLILSRLIEQGKQIKDDNSMII